MKPSAKNITACAAAVLLCAAVSCSHPSAQEAEVCEAEKTILFGIEADNYITVCDTVRNGETLGGILGSYGVSAATVDRLDRAARDIFPLKRIRSGKPYTAFIPKDSALARRIDHLVYEQSLTDYVVFSFTGDSVAVTTGQKPVTVRRVMRSSKIESSLWGAIMRDSLPYSLASELEDIYQWTVDFFSIQPEDSFTVIYEERFIDTLSVGIGRIEGAKFNHKGKDIYAIPFEQDGRLRYWEYDGGSLRKQMLKAPLKFTRISSRFSHARFHPVLKRYRPHHGVDYAAPKGTPVHAVADGTITLKGWDSKGGGNVLKIKHAGNMMTGYLHLSGFAKGIKQGAYVSQGQVIGYVGSTGVSTGPHLDFRVWRNGTPIDPLSIPQAPSEPISEQNRKAFEAVRDRIAAELDGRPYTPDTDSEEQTADTDTVKTTETEMTAATTTAAATATTTENVKR